MKQKFFSGYNSVKPICFISLTLLFVSLFWSIYGQEAFHYTFTSFPIPWISYAHITHIVEGVYSIPPVHYFPIALLQGNVHGAILDFTYVFLTFVLVSFAYTWWTKPRKKGE